MLAIGAPPPSPFTCIPKFYLFNTLQDKETLSKEKPIISHFYFSINMRQVKDVCLNTKNAKSIDTVYSNEPRFLKTEAALNNVEFWQKEGKKLNVVLNEVAEVYVHSSLLIGINSRSRVRCSSMHSSNVRSLKSQILYILSFYILLCWFTWMEVIRSLTRVDLI